MINITVFILVSSISTMLTLSFLTCEVLPKEPNLISRGMGGEGGMKDFPGFLVGKHSTHTCKLAIERGSHYSSTCTEAILTQYAFSTDFSWMWNGAGPKALIWYQAPPKFHPPSMPLLCTIKEQQLL